MNLAGTLNSFFGDAAPHFGHTRSSSGVLLMCSNPPHTGHTYSYIAMTHPLLIEHQLTDLGYALRENRQEQV